VSSARLRVILAGQGLTGFSGALGILSIFIEGRHTHERSMSARAAPPVFEVPPGHYTVELRLPSGERLLREGEVLAGQEQEVKFRLDEAPRGLPAWESFLHSEASPVASPAQKLVLRATKGLERELLSFLSEDAPRGLESTLDLPRGPNLSFLLGPHLQVQARLAHNPGMRVSSSTALRVQRLDDAATLRLLPIHAEAGACLHLSLRTPGYIWWLVLPPYWMNEAGSSQGATVVLRVAPGAGDTGISLSALVGDEVEAWLRFLQLGDIRGARALEPELGARAESALSGKVSNPYRAAAGACALLRLREYKRLHDWTRNLMNWFPSLPDGAVLEAWRLLAASDKNEQQAAQALAAALERGVPLLNESLRLLLDGLSLLGGSDLLPKERIAPWLALRRYIDPTAIFTTLRSPGPVLDPDAGPRPEPLCVGVAADSPPLFEETVHLK
jgi:hypothetical protein